MTIAELLVAAGLIAALYFGLRPVQRRLERFLLRWLHAGYKGKRVIDITDYTTTKNGRDKNEPRNH